MIDAKDLEKYLLTPQDSTKMPTPIFATTLVLSFIGMVARPSNIDKELLQKCCDVFNANRGKVETEVEEVRKVITEWRESHATEV